VRTQCTHYWVIPAADGPSSLGICKLCLESRLFDNSFPSPDFREIKKSQEEMELIKRGRAEMETYNAVYFEVEA